MSDVIYPAPPVSPTPKGFIEVPNTVPGHDGNNILINIQAIAVVFAGQGACSIRLLVPDLAISTSLSYNEIQARIKKAQQ